MNPWTKGRNDKRTKGPPALRSSGCLGVFVPWSLGHLVSLSLGLLCSSLPAGEAAKPATPPAVNWVLPLFTDKEGHRSMTLRGSAVQPAEGNSIAVTDLSITVFSGDAEAKVDRVLLSPSARFYPKENRATGDKSVRLIQDTVEVTGEDWTYDHKTKKVSINKNVRVTFHAQLNDILK